MSALWTILILLGQSTVPLTPAHLHPVCVGMGGIGVTGATYNTTMDGVKQPIVHVFCWAPRLQEEPPPEEPPPERSPQPPPLQKTEFRETAMRVDAGEGGFPLFTIVLLLNKSPRPLELGHVWWMCRLVGGRSAVKIYDVTLEVDGEYHPIEKFYCWPLP